MQQPPAHGFPSPTFCVSGGVSARSLTSPASPVAPSRTVTSWAQSCSMLSKFQAYLSTKVKGCVQWPKHLEKKKRKRTSCPGLSVQSAVPGTSGILLLTSADSTSPGCVASGTPSGVVSTSLEVGIISAAAAGSSRCSCRQKSPL